MPRKEVILLDFTKVKHFFELCKKMKNYLNLKLKIYIFKVLNFILKSEFSCLHLQTQYLQNNMFYKDFVEHFK